MFSLVNCGVNSRVFSLVILVAFFVLSKSATEIAEAQLQIRLPLRSGNKLSNVTRCLIDDDCARHIAKSICIDGQCRCPMNHRFRSYGSSCSCVRFRCSEDRQCREWDPLRRCSSLNHNCVCPDGHATDLIDRKCHPTNNVGPLLVVALLPITLVLVFLVRCVRLARTNMMMEGGTPRHEDRIKIVSHI